MKVCTAIAKQFYFMHCVIFKFRKLIIIDRLPFMASKLKKIRKKLMYIKYKSLLYIHNLIILIIKYFYTYMY